MGVFFTSDLFHGSPCHPSFLCHFVTTHIPIISPVIFMMDNHFHSSPWLTPPWSSHRWTLMNLVDLPNHSVMKPALSSHQYISSGPGSYRWPALLECCKHCLARHSTNVLACSYKMPQSGKGNLTKIHCVKLSITQHSLKLGSFCQLFLLNEISVYLECSYLKTSCNMTSSQFRLMRDRNRARETTHNWNGKKYIYNQALINMTDITLN